jgi:hypothetical protein
MRGDNVINMGFVSATIHNQDLFWAALGALAQTVEALVVLVSAIVVIFQLRRMRQESIRDRIAGLRTAIEILDSELLRKVVKEIPTGATIRGVNWDEFLDQLDLVALLITEKYTDENLLLKLKGHELYSIAEYLHGTPLESDLRKHPGAQWILMKAREHIHGYA